MKDWGPLDWIGFGGLGLTTAFLAINAAILTFPAIRRNVPRGLRRPQWGFIPIICFAIATVALVARLLSPNIPPLTPAVQSVIAVAPEPIPVPSTPPPPPLIVNTAENAALRHLAYALSAEIRDFVESYYDRRYKIGQSPAELRAQKTEDIEKEISDKFKEKFKFRFITLWHALADHGSKKFSDITFNQNIIDIGNILSSASFLDERARELP